MNARGAVAWAVAAAVLASAGHAQVPTSPAPELRIDGPPSLPLGASGIFVIVRLPQGPAMPLLLTVRVEGEGLQAVRARFLRADGKLEPSGELRFTVPVYARAPGIAVVRAELATYRCAQSCEPVRAQGALQLHVEDWYRGDVHGRGYPPAPPSKR